MSSYYNHRGAGYAGGGAPAGTREKYDKLEKLGEGTYGVVYKGKDRETGNIVAIKKIRISSRDDDEGIPQTALREIGLLRALSHPNIVKLLDVDAEASKLNLVFEFCEKDLKKHMDSHRGKFDATTVKRMLKQMLEATTTCHIQGLIHRDLKPQNILVDRSGTLKICDFGLARAFSVPISTMTHEVVTLWYRAPEILLAGTKHNHYSVEVDIWSIGAIFAEIHNKKAIFPADTEIQELNKIFSILGTPNESVWPGVTRMPDWKRSVASYRAKSPSDIVPGLCSDGQDLFMKLLTYDPSKRISGKDALQHPYFRGI
jgi:serine/threonine protein kinase